MEVIPLLKLGKNRSGVMDRKMLTSMVYAFASIILGVSFCSLSDKGLPIPSRNNGESKRLSFSICSASVSLKGKGLWIQRSLAKD